MAEKPTPPPPDPQAAYAEVLRLIRYLDSGAGDAKIVYRTSTGRRSVIAVPADGNESDDPTGRLTDMQRAVVQAVDEMRPGTVKSFEEIAEAAGFSNSEGLREFVRQLSAVGRLEKVHRGWQKK